MRFPVLLRCLCCLITLLALTTLGKAKPPSLKVMSFNVRFDGATGSASAQRNAWIAESGESRRNLALKVVAAYAPDILGVQEALTNQIGDLKSQLPRHGFYGVGRDDGNKHGEYCGIFYREDRFERHDQGTFWLNEYFEKPGSKFPKTCCARIASWIILKDREADDREFFVLNTHWDHQIQAARVFSSKLIRQRLPELAGEAPMIVMGDLNAAPTNPAFTALLQAPSPTDRLLVDSYRAAHPQEKLKSDPLGSVSPPKEGTVHGFTGRLDGHRIDYILHSEQLRTQMANIVRTHQEDRYPADHFPVTAILQWVAE